MAGEIDPDKLEILLKIEEEKNRRRTQILKQFIPGNPAAVPFNAQIQFLKDDNKAKLMRCGNRAAKSFTAMRDLAWKMLRCHWYRQDWNVLDLSKKNWKDKLGTEEYERRYLTSPKKVFWVVGPTYDFIGGVLWTQYLKEMLPDSLVKEVRLTTQKNISKVIMRNGDVLEFKTYTQQETSKMGFSVHEIYCDEMGTDAKEISELMVRLFDKDGSMTLGFTPLVEDPDFVNYIDSRCEAGVLSLHSWSVLDNPLYRDNPERMARVMAEYEHLPEHERLARVRGDWYVVPKGQHVFEGVFPQEVEDFEVPIHWRRARVADPAANVTGYAEFAEDPSNGQWYCILGREITWGTAAKASDILAEMEKYRPYPEFRYCLALYDNAANWFGAYAMTAGFRPCMEKDRESAFAALRQLLSSGELKIFKHAAATAINQFKMYRFSTTAEGKVVKKKDHVLDCLFYFARQKPKPLVDYGEDTRTEKQRIFDAHMKAKEQKALKLAPANRYGYSDRHIQTLRRRGIR